MAAKISTVRPLDMPLETWIANMHASLAERIAAAEAKLAARPKSAKATAPKSETESDSTKAKRPPTDWIVFCGRVRALLKANDLPIDGGVKNFSKFCSHLKGINSAYASWADEAIVEARSGWVPSVSTSDAETPAPPAPVAEKKAVKPRAKKTA